MEAFVISTRDLYLERLKRYRAAIALKKPDRIPISTASNFFAEIYAGHNNQEFVYDANSWQIADEVFIKKFPEVDSFRSGRIWGPLHDSVGFNLYKLPGRELSPNSQFQFVEAERMKSDEYDLLLENPVRFIFERFLPIAFDDYTEPGSFRSYIAFLKGGMAAVANQNLTRARQENLEKSLGMPLSTSGIMLAPFDYLADGLRGLRGIMLDLHRQPDNVKAACEVLVPDIINTALLAADPSRRYPIFVPLHCGSQPLLSPKQFEEFYWPTLKIVLTKIIEAGYTVRAYLEGDWGPIWQCFKELPRGKIICDIDVQGDIFQAKKDLHGYQCIAGGIPDSTLILGNPEDVKERVKLLCETVAIDGGFIMNGSCNIPYNTKPENFKAMVDATLKYGTYSKVDEFDFIESPLPPDSWKPPEYKTITSWEEKKQELGTITGDEKLIKNEWEKFEHMAYSWLFSWLW